jgi:hypothetical protein
VRESHYDFILCRIYLILHMIHFWIFLWRCVIILFNTLYVIDRPRFILRTQLFGNCIQSRYRNWSIPAAYANTHTHMRVCLCVLVGAAHCCLLLPSSCLVLKYNHSHL